MGHTKAEQIANRCKVIYFYVVVSGGSKARVSVIAGFVQERNVHTKKIKYVPGATIYFSMFVV